MKKVLFYVFMIMFCIFSQAQNSYNNPVNFPTSPSVSSFLKYGDIPVNEYTGKALITVPVYTINIDGISLPLNLNYSTGGIKVADEASMVGLGWDFNLPAITQQVMDKDDYFVLTKHRDLPDFVGSTGLPESGPVDPIFYTTNYLNLYNPVGKPYRGDTKYKDEPHYYLANNNLVVEGGVYNNYSFQEMFSSQYFDTEPDIFKLNLNGIEIIMITSNFSIYGGTSIRPGLKIINGRTEYKVETIDPKINNPDTSRIGGIMVTDPSGTKYYFEVQDIIKCPFSITNGYLDGSASTNISSAISSRTFKLSKIESFLGKTINIQYKTTNVIDIRKLSQVYVKRLGTTNSMAYYDSNSSGFQENSANGFHIKHKDYSYNYLLGIRNFFIANTNSFEYLEGRTWFDGSQTLNYVSSISTPMETITFDYSDRLDYSNNLKLDKISVYNNLNKKINQFDFAYQYFTDYSNTLNYGTLEFPSSKSGISTYDTENNRLKLLSITELGKKPYVFTYYTENLPNKTSYATDYWGYYNGVNNSSFIPPLSDLGYPQYDSANTNSKLSVLSFTQACSLQKITYPTGGYTEFIYELNRFDYLFNKVKMPNAKIIQEGNGLRVQKTINYTGKEGSTPEITEYKYYNGKSMCKKYITLMYESSLYIEDRYYDGVDSRFLRKHATDVLEIDPAGFIRNHPLNEPDYIGYDYVDIIKSNGTGGKTRKYFVNNPNEFIETVSPENSNDRNFRNMYLLKKYKEQNGSITKQEFYDSNEVKKKEISYIYGVRGDEYTNRSNYGMNIQGGKIKVLQGNNRDLIYTIIIPQRILTFYPVFSSSTILSVEMSTSFFDNKGVTTSLTTVTTYGYDLYNRMNELINYNKSLSIYEYIDDGRPWFWRFKHSFKETTEFVPATEINFLRPKSIKTYNESQLIKQQDFSYNEQKLLKEYKDCKPNLTSSSISQEQCVTIIYDVYDNKGNILQYTPENGTPVSIIWGYNQTQPIAKIENATYSSITASLITAAQTASNTGTEASLLTALTAIRNALPNAMITTYTHIPLVGVSTITDPKGDKITYIYDAFGRLQFVKDKNGNLLSENEYHYKP